MASSFKNKLIFRISKGIMDHPLWQKWQQTNSREFQPNILSIDELVEFARQYGIEEVDILYDVDGARCRLTGRMFHIHKIADTPYLAVLSAVADLQKEAYEIEINQEITSCT